MAASISTKKAPVKKKTETRLVYSDLLNRTKNMAGQLGFVPNPAELQERFKNKGIVATMDVSRQLHEAVTKSRQSQAKTPVRKEFSQPAQKTSTRYGK